LSYPVAETKILPFVVAVAEDAETALVPASVFVVYHANVVETNVTAQIARVQIDKNNFLVKFFIIVFLLF
jgi:hypothetical protein